LIVEGTGDLFAADVEALVNAVNIKGVMGKGLALAFKQKFPDNFAAYRRACDAGEVETGRMFVVERATPPRWIVNFPTKRHWRQPSQLEDIRTGLGDLAAQIARREIHSIAVPALGCGLGGLAWTDVRPLIVEALGTTSARVVLFGPG
jgi:O-acetyl-ADP-ribose deacetylase (regulator of RNase III)